MWTSVALLIGSLFLPAAPAPRTPVLVELFTSEGCSSCPPADALLARLLEGTPVDGVDVVALGLHVDYWDRLGWKDPFSSPLFSQRQEAYGRIFGEDRIYTPQMVVDGAAEFVGSDSAAAAKAIRAASEKPHVPIGASADLRGDLVRIAADAPPVPPGTSEKIAVLVALVEDGLTSNVKRGENSGRTLTHAAVVRRIETIGALDRDAFAGEGQWKLNPAWDRAKLRVVAFLQGQSTRKVYGSAQVRLAAR